MNNVFVYGTLKRGCGNHHVMERAGGEYIGEMFTPHAFDLVDLGGFPAVIKGGYGVGGELYRVEDLSPLDWLEGHPNFYERHSVDIGWQEPAWIYMFNEWDRPVEITGQILLDESENKTWMPRRFRV